MSGEINEAALMNERPTADIARLRTRSIVLAVVGLVGLLGGYLTQPHELLLQAYLIAFVFWVSVTIGSLAILMVQHLSGGAWGLFARRVLEASTRMVPVLAVLFIPIAMNLPVLYPWARPDAVNDKIIQEKALYLNTTFFYIRAVIYFVIWGTLAYFLNRWSAEQDGEPTRLPGPKDSRFRVLSGPGLVLYMLTITFMSVDWILSLQPHFSSTIFGILILGGQGLSTMAFTILILAALSKTSPVARIAKPDLFHDLGKLMLAFVMLWAYFSISQLIIIYQGNLPEEIPYYVTRFGGKWLAMSIAVLLGHFVLPFALLLSRNFKRQSTSLARIAMFVLAMRVIDIVWMVGPMFDQPGVMPLLVDFAAVLAMGGIWLAFFFRALGGRSLVPAHDPYFKEAMAHVGH
jgi:hypothetical protein